MTDDQPFPLSPEEARLLAEQLAVLANAGLPLASGLRAAAEEIPSPRLKTAMTSVAERLERGRSLDDVLRGSPRLMPEHMLRLVETGIRSGNLPEVLTHLVEIDRSWFDLRRSVRIAIAYPLLLMALCVMLLVFVTMCIVPGFQEVMKGFNVALPWTTQALFWFSGDRIIRILGVGAAATSMLIIGMRISLPPQHWRWMITRIPFIGPIQLWHGIANWARLASLLLKQGLPAPEAMRLAATGVNDALMAVEGLRLSRAAANGRSISESLKIIGSLPASIVPLVRWGEENNSLPEAFDTVAEMFENRLRLRAALLQSIMPPVAFIFTALFGLWLMNALFLPLVELISSLSGGARRRGTVPTASGGGFDLRGVGAFIVVVVGIALWVRFMLIITRDTDKKSGPVESPGIMAVVRIVLWVIFFLALLALMASLASVLGFILWLFTLIVALTVKIRHSDAERRALMWLLGTAVEKGIPLSFAARSFGEERNDRLGRKTRKLAFQLDRGATLDQSLENARIRLPDDALVAVRTGSVAKSMAPLVEAMTKRSASADSVVHSLAAKLIYMAVFVFFAGVMIAFMQIKILPAFVKIYKDFNQPMPASTRLLIHAGSTALPYAFLIFWVLVLLFAAMIFALVRYTGLIRWDPPLIRRFSLPLDEANILRALAGAVAHQQPIAEMVQALALKYPKGYIRRRLINAYAEIAKGVDWCDSLNANGLLPQRDAAVLKAAERVGNLAWAMNEVADRLSHRFVTRVNAILAVAFPAVLFIFAGVVFLVAYGMIEPLSKLILSLT